MLPGAWELAGHPTARRCEEVACHPRTGVWRSVEADLVLSADLDLTGRADLDAAVSVDPLGLQRAPRAAGAMVDQAGALAAMRP